MKTLKKILVFILICCFSINIYIITNANTLLESADRTNLLEAEYHNPTINDNFEDNKIIVTLTKEYSEVNKQVNMNIFKIGKIVPFGEINNQNCELDKIVIKNIKDITYMNNPDRITNIDDFCQILELELLNNDKQAVLDGISELEKLDYVETAEPVYKVTKVMDTIPNDPYLDRQWALNDTNGIKAKLALDFCDSYNMSGVKIGVFENNIQMDHPDLRVLFGNLRPSDDVDKTHGTFVSGLISAISNNAVGIAGISQATIFLLDGEWENFAESLVWAIDNGIKIVNASFHYVDQQGKPFEATPSHAQAIRNFSENGGLLIASAGNDNENIDYDEVATFPACYGRYQDIDNVICVGALAKDNSKYSSSNYGTESVDIYAPGQEILSTFPENCWGQNVEYFTQISSGYAIGSGTSASAPLVTGTVALLLSIYPQLTFSELKSIILDCADNITISANGIGKHTVKKLNVINAVKYTVSRYCESVAIKYNNATINSYVNNNSARLFVKDAIIKLNVLNAYNYRIKVSADNVVKVNLYDENLDEISLPNVNNGAQIDFNKNLDVGVYFLRITYVNTNAGDITTTIYGEEHDHLYTSWKYNGHMNHIEKCRCGMTGLLTKPHVVRSSDVNNYKAKCLECKYVLDLRVDMASTIMKNQSGKMSLNGSKILASGIILLVDKDIEAYLNGTLKFYSKDTTEI